MDEDNFEHCGTFGVDGFDLLHTCTCGWSQRYPFKSKLVREDFEQMRADHDQWVQSKA